MTVTVTQVGRTANELTFLVANDGGAGNTFVLTNALLVASLVAGPLKELLEDDGAVITTALARQQLLGQPATDTELTNIPHAHVIQERRSGGIAGNMSIDADQDGNTATRSELNLVLTDVLAAQHILRLKFSHTIIR